MNQDVSVFATYANEHNVYNAIAVMGVLQCPKEDDICVCNFKTRDFTVHAAIWCEKHPSLEKCPFCIQLLWENWC